MKRRKKTKEEKYQEKFNKKADNFFKILLSIPGLIVVGLIAYFLDPEKFLENTFEIFGFAILVFLGAIALVIYLQFKDESDKKLNYIWVIIGSIAAGIFTSILRWDMTNTPVYIERSNDPYVYLLGVILILHFFYIIFNLDKWFKKNKSYSNFIKNESFVFFVVIIILIVFGIIGFYLSNWIFGG